MIYVPLLRYRAGPDGFREKIELEVLMEPCLQPEVRAPIRSNQRIQGEYANECISALSVCPDSYLSYNRRPPGHFSQSPLSAPTKEAESREPAPTPPQGNEARPLDAIDA
jgi:hypothetical protein